MPLVARRSRPPAECVLGIDQSYSGFAIVALAADGSLVNETCKGFPAPGGARRLANIQLFLHRYLMQFPIKHVAMEDYARGRRNGREEAGELGGIVKHTLWLELPDPIRYPTVISPSAVKKFATGRGTAEKSDMKLAVYKKWDYDTRNDNLADAYTIAKIAHRITYGGDSLAYELDVLGKLRRHTEWHPQD